MFVHVAQNFLYHMQYGRATPISLQTLDSYTRGVKLLAGIIGQRRIVELDTDDIADIRKSLYDRNCSQGYVHKLLSIVRSVLRYCDEQLHLDVMPPQKVKLPPNKHNEVEFYTFDQLEKIFKEIKSPTIQGLRMMAVITAFLDTGARITELLSLNREQLEHGLDTAKIIGKGNKVRMIYFRPWSLSYIMEYLKYRKDDNPALFVTHQKAYEIRRLPPGDIRKDFRRIAKIVGFAVRPHRLRKTFATHLDDHETSLRYIQKLLGHSSISVTERYIGTNPLTLKRILSEKLYYGDAEKVMQPIMRWSRNYDKCVACGETSRPHSARGYCHRCHTRAERAGVFKKQPEIEAVGVSTELCLTPQGVGV